MDEISPACEFMGAGKERKREDRLLSQYPSSPVPKVCTQLAYSELREELVTSAVGDVLWDNFMGRFAS